MKNNKRRPRVDLALKISEILKKPLNEIFYLEDKDWKP